MCKRVVITLLAFTAALVFGYSGGDGTAANPYQISSAEDFNTLATTPADWGASFLLTQPIDLSSYANLSVGTALTPFTGSFSGGDTAGEFPSLADGRKIAVSGNAITGYSLTGTGSRLGLFGYLGTGAVIENILLIDPTVTGGPSSDRVGAICGESNGASILNCTALNSLGSLSTAVNVQGDDDAGGICAYASASTISGCFSNLNVQSDTEVGGIAGYIRTGTVLSSCASAGIITSTNTINSKAGGVVGNSSDAIIRDCYSLADVSGSKTVGGFVGISAGEITRCYAAGSVSYTLTYAGGFAGYLTSGPITGSFYSTDGGLSGIGAGATSSGLTGKTDAGLKLYATYSDAGYDFDTTWLIVDVKDYPRLDGVGVQPIELPNLTVAVSETAHSVYTGQQVTVSCQETNNGTEIADFHNTHLFYSRFDEGWDELVGVQGSFGTAEDPNGVFGEIAVNSVSEQLAIGGSKSDSFTFTVPNFASVLYFRVYTDANDEISELSETDNWSQTIAVSVSTIAELTVSLAPAQTTEDPGTDVTLTATVLNSGTGDAGEFAVKLYRSSEPVADWTIAILSQTATLQDSKAVAGLAAGAETGVDFTVTSLGGAGDDYYAAWVDYDDVITEIDNANNVSGSSQVHVDPQVETAVLSAPATLGSLAVGNTLAFNATISNTADGSTGAFSVALELSENGTDWTIASVEQITDIAPASSAQVSFDFIPALTAGTYQARLVVDSNNDLEELDETNNVTSLGTLTMLDKADLYFVSAPASLGTVLLGDDVSVDVTIGNEGDIAAGAFVVSLQLSSDGGASWNTVATAPVSGLAADASISKTLVYTATANEGTYQMRVAADYAQAVDETDRADNIRATGSLTVEVAVDLVVTAADSLGTVYINDTVNCSATVKNIGTAAAGSFEVALMLSPNGANWYQADKKTVTSLAADASTAVDFSFATTSVGAYQAKIRVNSNSAVVESDSSNNELAAGTLSVIDRLDVSCSLPSYAYTPVLDVMAGEQVFLTLKIQNSGTDTVNNVVTALLISQTTDFSGADTAALYTAAYVFPGIEASGNFTFTAPVAGGTYYLRALTDSTATVNETNEDNNYSADTITLNVTPSIDLSATAWPADGVSSYLGGTVSVDATVTNTGASNSGNFSVALYKADSATADWASLTPVQTKTVFSLAKDATSDLTFEFDVTETEAASLYLNIIIDGADAVSETNEANNSTGAFALSISEKYSGGLGTEASPYLISTAADLASMAASPADMDKYFLQTADITAGAIAPIADISSQFEGQYDGDGYTISGLVSNISSSGLFQYIKAGGVVKNLLVVDADVSATLNAGIIASNNSGTISGCFTSGVVSGVQAGGIAYLNWGTIENCYSTATVNATNVGGGIAANSNSHIMTNCYASGKVSGINKGALAAYASGATVTGCYWNAALSGVSTSAAGEEKTLAEMCSADTFSAWSAAIWRTGSGLLPTFIAQELPEADITVSADAATATAFRGADVDVDFTLANAGSSALGAFDTVLLLSTDESFTTPAQVDSATTAGLTAGADDSVTFTFDTTGYAAGTYYLKAVADGANAVTETDEINESAVVTLTINAGIDLSVSYAGSSISGYTSVAESVTVTATNSGLDDSGDFTVSLLFANNSAVASAQTISLTGGASRDVTFDFTTPATAGAYPLHAVVDAANAVKESNESNQTANISLTVLNSPDLTASVSTADVNAYSGKDFTVSVTVSNDGLAPAGASTAELYYGSSDDFASAALYGSKAVSSISAGANRSVSFTVNLAEGAYYFWAVADSADVVYEHNTEDNNVSASAHATVKPDYDLAISIDESELSSYFSEDVTVNVTITNLGTTEAGASTAKLYLGGEEVDSAVIAAGQSAAAFSFTAPAAPGTYTVTAVIDTASVVDESDETNNTSAGVTLTVMPKIDLAIEFLSGDLKALVGADAAALFKVTNIGNGTSSASQATLLVNAADSDWDTQSRDIETLVVPALGENEAFYGTFSFAASPDGGRFYLKAVSDYADADSANNETAVITFDSQYAFSGGLGTAEYPYLLSTAQDIVDLASTDAQMDASYKLTCNIDMTGAPASPIGSADAPFTGVFDGNYYVISNFKCTADSAALFDTLAGAVVNDLGIENPDVYGTGAAALAVTAIDSQVSGCYAAGGSISGTDYAAGLVVRATGTSHVNNCFTSTTVTDASTACGFVFNVGTGASVTNCYAATATSTLYTAYPFAGNTGVITGCFYDSANGTGGSGTALSGAEMADAASFTGWDFDLVWAMNATAPELVWQNGMPGTGDESDPYIIRTEENLVAVSQDPNLWDSYYRLEADLDFYGKELDTKLIGNWPANGFTGSFDGGGHNINGYCTEQGYFSGIFGLNAGLIENLNVSGIVEDGESTWYIGALCAANEGTIRNCSADEVVMTIHSDSVGAGVIAGVNTGEIYGCSAFGSITVTEESDISYVGFIAGFNEPAYIPGIVLYGISDCYASGNITVSGVACGAGLITGLCNAGIADSYAVGAVTDMSGWNACGAVAGVRTSDLASILTNCVFDSSYMTEGVGDGSADGTIGKTSADMQLYSSYADAGWDTSAWLFEQGNYPILKWEAGAEAVMFYDIAENWLVETPQAGDLNNDGVVDIADFAIAASLAIGQLN